MKNKIVAPVLAIVVVAVVVVHCTIVVNATDGKEFIQFITYAECLSLSFVLHLIVINFISETSFDQYSALFG